MRTSSDVAAPIFRRAERSAPFRVPVRHRDFLAGSAHASFPESVPDIGEMVPTLVAQRADCPHPVLAAAVRKAVDETLPASGGVLLRGLPVTARAAFEQLVTGLGYEPVGYRGGIAVRGNGSGTALQSSQEDRRITLSPHNEMAYLAAYPRKVFFFCESAASIGGEVPINDVRETLRMLPEQTRELFRRRGIRYHRNLPRLSSDGESGWVDTFGTDDKQKVEQHLTASGYAYRWHAGDDRLRYHYTRSAFITHPETGEALWFNQVTELNSSYWRSHPDFHSDLSDSEYPATTTYGDGAAIEEDLISFLRGALWQTTRAVRMTPGDVLVLDNLVLQHGRFAFEGPRRHFVSLTS